MSEARRQQARMAMLPHLSGKFSVDRFIRTGSVAESVKPPLPDTPAMRAAREEWERDQEIIAQRRMNRYGG
jgi:hypothetical protein